jgi:cell division protein ZapA
MPSAEVFILGKKYTLKGESTKEQILQLGGFIDDRIKEVCSKYPGISPEKAMLVAMFNMAEELHHLKAEQEILSRQIREKTDLLSDMFE